MPKAFNAKITHFSIKKKESAELIESKKMNETIPRPEILTGKTYKLKPPGSDHAFYITINDISIENKTYPYEIFIQSKDMSHYQWSVALTRTLSAVFRKGGELQFLIKELKEVFDPKGGYWAKGGKYVPSLVAGIGYILEEHLNQPEAS